MSNLQAVIESYGVHPELGAEANGFWIEQSPYELAAFLEAIEPLGIKTVLEIGTGHKAGLARFMSEFLGWKVVSVDIHQPFVSAPLVDLRVSATRLDFPNTRFDLVIIDADHQYESIQADYEHYGKYADKVVMFHDIAGLRGCEGAAAFWKDVAFLRGTYRDKNELEPKLGIHYVFDPNEGSRCGIGWVDVQAAKVPTVDKMELVEISLMPDGTIEPTIKVDAPAEEAPKPKAKPGRKPKAKLQ